MRFYMLMGLPGAGKSWYADALARDIEVQGGDPVIHASDAIREELFHDVSSQQDNDLVFQELHARVKRDLKEGKDVIYDATNLSYKRRKSFLETLNSLHLEDLKTTCILVYKPYDQCLEVNASRDRIVPEPVIASMRKRFDPPLKSEGWDRIDVVHNWNQRPYSGGYLFSRLDGFQQDNPNHSLTLGEHIKVAVRLYVNDDTVKEFDDCIFWALYFHDIGKESTKTFFDAKGNVSEYAHYYNHENVGAYDSFTYMVGYPMATQLRISRLIRWHMYPFTILRSQNPPKTRQKLKNLLGEEDYKAVMTMFKYDRAAHRRNHAGKQRE